MGARLAPAWEARKALTAFEAYAVRRYPEGTRTADDAARAIGCDVGAIVKSLVFVVDGVGPVMALTSGANRVDLHKLAHHFGAPSARQATAKEARAATGYAVGGTPPFGHTTQLPAVFDPALMHYETVWAAAGTPDTCFPITPAALAEASGAMVSDVTVTDPATAWAETLQFLEVRPGTEPGEWRAETPAWFGPYLFGGFVVAQTIVAALRDAPAGSRLHSLHAYYLRPVAAQQEVVYRTTDVKQGRAFTTRRVEAAQGGKPVFDMTCSFTTDAGGDVYVYDLPGRADDVPPLDSIESEPGPGPWLARWVGPSAPAPDGTRESTHRAWFRVGVDMPDDPVLHTAMLGFASDWTGIGGRPRHLEGDTTGMVSLDHAVWFHRPARADAWHFYDVQALVNAGGRGTLRGVLRDTDGRVVASVAQEMLLAKI